VIIPCQKKIWIDLDNSPHVPFFLPIIEELDKRGYKIFLTARDSYQVCELLSFHGLSNKVKVIGRHWGKNRVLKILGTLLRVAQLLPRIMIEKPDLAVAHGSRGLILSSFVAGIPTLILFDYEFASGAGGVQSDWAFLPDLIPESTRVDARRGVMRYPGLKEDVYISQLRPDHSLRTQLGLDQTDLVVTVRPPATEAHYHNPEAEVLLKGVLDLLTHRPDVRVVLVPRNENQARALRVQWSKWIADRKIIIPDHVVNGLNLIWLSDLVISGGGTMNREAAALGVPVYSIFRGKIGAVDRYLVEKGRLTLIESLEDVRTKIVIERRVQGQGLSIKSSAARDCIVEGVISIVEHRCLPTRR
jgi:predicted glycosyltransferase